MHLHNLDCQQLFCVVLISAFSTQIQKSEEHPRMPSKNCHINSLVFGMLYLALGMLNACMAIMFGKNDDTYAYVSS